MATSSLPVWLMTFFLLPTSPPLHPPLPPSLIWHTNTYNPLHARAGHDAVNCPFRSLRVLHLLPLAVVNYFLHRTTRTTTRPSFVLSPCSAAEYDGEPDTLLNLCDSDSVSKYEANGGDAKVGELIAAGINLRHQVRE